MSKFLLSIVLIVALLSCGQDHPVQEKSLLGEWEIIMAKRDGKVTKSLDMTQVHFVTDTSMVSNLLTEGDTTSYRVVGDELQILGVPPTDLDIRSLSQDTLVLSTRINRHRYDMIFRRPKKSLS